MAGTSYQPHPSSAQAEQASKGRLLHVDNNCGECTHHAGLACMAPAFRALVSSCRPTSTLTDESKQTGMLTAGIICSLQFAVPAYTGC